MTTFDIVMIVVLKWCLAIGIAAAIAEVVSRTMMWLASRNNKEDNDEPL